MTQLFSQNILGRYQVGYRSSFVEEAIPTRAPFVVLGRYRTYPEAIKACRQKQAHIGATLQIFDANEHDSDL